MWIKPRLEILSTKLTERKSLEFPTPNYGMCMYCTWCHFKNFYDYFINRKAHQQDKIKFHLHT